MKTRYLYLAPHPLTYEPHGELSNTSDLREYFGAIENQGPLGACSAFASTQWYSAWRVKHGLPWIEYSELAQYWEERQVEGTIDQDSGATIWDAVYVLERYGVMPEDDDPYKPPEFENKPPEQDFISGSKLPPQLVRRISQTFILEDTLDALTQGLPVLFGFTVFPELESQEVAQTGILPLPQEGEQPLGGHAVIAVGHDLNAQRILVRNQWGADWGLDGYFWMPFEYFSSFVSEAYVIDDDPVD